MAKLIIPSIESLLQLRWQLDQTNNGLDQFRGERSHAKLVFRDDQRLHDNRSAKEVTHEYQIHRDPNLTNMASTIGKLSTRLFVFY